MHTTINVDVEVTATLYMYAPCVATTSLEQPAAEAVFVVNKGAGGSCHDTQMTTLHLL